MPESTRLFRSKYHAFTPKYFSCTNFRKCRGLDILCGFFFANEKDFTSKYIDQSGTIFWFGVSFVTCFWGKFKVLRHFHTHENIGTWEKEVRISMLFGEDTPSTPMLVSRTTFPRTSKLWSSPQYPVTMKTWRSPWKQWVPTYREKQFFHQYW